MLYEGSWTEHYSSDGEIYFEDHGDFDRDPEEEEAQRADEPRKKPKGRNKKMGARGEAAAARYLELCGYEILERNWECPAGEADIIARDQDTVVFVEVKTRSNFKKGFPSEAVTEKKRARYEKIAAWYFHAYGGSDIPIRFDVIAILALGNDRGIIKHYVNAFSTRGL